jgi:hypothetical protein
MLIDASVARSVAVLGWIEHLAQAVGGSLAIAHGVIGIDTDEPSELRRIRDALEREINTSPHGSGRYSKAVAAVQGLDTLLHLGPPTITLLIPDSDEVRMAARLTSRQADDREWRHGLGLRARRLDTGEAVSISIAHVRGIDFASDDGQALVAYTALTTRPPIRTRDVIKLLVNAGMIDEATGREGYRFLREDDLHLLGGPDW